MYRDVTLIQANFLKMLVFSNMPSCYISIDDVKIKIGSLNELTSTILFYLIPIS